MGLRINTNVASLSAQRNLHKASNQLRKSFGRLSSGLRISRASDDAAIALAESMALAEAWVPQAKLIGGGGPKAARIAFSPTEVSSFATRMIGYFEGKIAFLRERAAR